MRLSARLLMWFFAITNLGFLVWAVLDPFTIANFVGLEAASPDANSEVRAMYGGLIGGLGAVSLIGALSPKRLESSVWATAWAFTGIGLVRICSCLIFSIDGWQLVFSLSELAAAVTCFWLLARMEATGSLDPLP